MRFLATLLLITSTLTGASDPNVVVAGWKTSPVYVDPTERSLVPDDEAAKLAERVEGHVPAIRIAVVPEDSLDDGRRDKQMSAHAFVDTVAYKQGSDGIYLVVFGRRVTAASAVGVGTPIDSVLAGELAEHSRSDAVGTLNGVLDRLGAPEASSGFPGWLLAFLIVMAVLVGGGLALWRWRWRWWPGQGLAPEPDETVPEEPGTLEERRAHAREDVTRFGAELESAHLGLDGLGDKTEAAADVQAAKGAYTTAARVLDGQPDDDQLRGVRATVGYGRWRLACAQARIAGKPIPAWRALGRSGDSRGV